MHKVLHTSDHNICFILPAGPVHYSRTSGNKDALIQPFCPLYGGYPFFLEISIPAREIHAWSEHIKIGYMTLISVHLN